MSYTELEHGYQVNIFSCLKKKSCICQVSNEILLIGSQKCKQTNVLHRRYKYGAIVYYSFDLSFVEKSKFEFTLLSRKSSHQSRNSRISKKSCHTKHGPKFIFSFNRNTLMWHFINCKMLDVFLFLNNCLCNCSYTCNYIKLVCIWWDITFMSSTT